ncbi:MULTISPECIES: hypothetical protein [Brevibacillus]|uniref:hypothetical protein n=1 Tax=Brevibacillus TaxID=55080 RepID=UPI00156A8CCC|nr:MULTISPECIES: hypothetical protein [Brevibacillus]MED2254422.1 hypothetical protein [Brevibacillus parabrevis]NRQ54566.1 hypothetical protein [Brevibacillus sp. HD1.4A]
MERRARFFSTLSLVQPGFMDDLRESVTVVLTRLLLPVHSNSFNEAAIVLFAIFTLPFFQTAFGGYAFHFDRSFLPILSNNLRGYAFPS